MAAALFELPAEIRQTIWNYVYGENDITPQAPLDIPDESCAACVTITRPISHKQYYQPALVCRQLLHESNRLLNDVTLHISQSAIFEQLYRLSTRRLSKVKELVLYVHLEDANRMEWLITLTKIKEFFPHIRQLTIYNHMRPPYSYENLLDGIFLAAPLVSLPTTIDQKLHFDYVTEDVMFSSPFLGEIRCSDALEEHELVIRDLIQDDDFRAGACVQDITHMTAALLRIARSHEQPWFQKLQRRRLEELIRSGALS